MAIQKRTFKDVAALQPYLVFVTGRVAIGASGAVGAQTGKGFTVARTGTGLYTITPTNTGGVPAILYCHVSVGNNSATVQHASFVQTLPTTGVITAMTSDASTPETAADPASGSFLQFFAVVQNVSFTG